MNYIWAGMILLSFLSAAAGGRMNAVSQAVISGGTDAITLCLKMGGMLCLWGGLMNIAEKSGLTTLLEKAFAPALRLIFPYVKKESGALRAISMNLTANLLGLGNAATPLGIEAMRRLQNENMQKDTASFDMIKFVVMNSAAFHLIPTTVAMLRQQHGAASPMDIMPASWLTSILSLSCGLSAAILFQKFSQRKLPVRHNKKPKKKVRA
jgi:spore maturation protein A